MYETYELLNNNWLYTLKAYILVIADSVSQAIAQL